MQIKFTLLPLMILLVNLVSAQTDQVSIKTNYTHQTYYNISTGASVSVPNDAWDLAFSNVGLQDAGVIYNESAALDSKPLKVFLAPTTSWTEAITDTTVFKDSLALLNPKKSWSEGAFNSVKASTSPFDYGWGVYNPATNTVVGTRIFVIKKRDGSFVKFQVENLVVNDYKFRIANLDGSNEVEAVITKDKGVSGKILYYSFDAGKVTMPTDYDLVFQRYRTPVPVGDGSFLDYNVTGVLLGPGVEAVVADGVDPTTVNEANYVDKYSKNISTIGYEWKSFDLNAGWSMDVDRTQFVKARNGNKYQITFFDYEGSTTGVTTLGRKLIPGNAVINALQNDIHVYPNPTADMVTIDGLEDNAKVSVSDNVGRVVLNIALTKGNNRLSMLQLPLGIYSVKIETAKGTAVKQIVKK